MNSMPTDTRRRPVLSLDDFHDTSRFVMVEDVPMLDTHEEISEDKPAVDLDLLRLICENTNRKIKKGSFPPAFMGHRCDPDTCRETDQPPVAGYVLNWRLGEWHGDPCLHADIYYLKSKWSKAKEFPFRSVERYVSKKPERNVIDAVALLATQPERDLGVLEFNSRAPKPGDFIARYGQSLPAIAFKPASRQRPRRARREGYLAKYADGFGDSKLSKQDPKSTLPGGDSPSLTPPKSVKPVTPVKPIAPTSEVKPVAPVKPSSADKSVESLASWPIPGKAAGTTPPKDIAAARAVSAKAAKPNQEQLGVKPVVPGSPPPPTIPFTGKQQPVVRPIPKDFDFGPNQPGGVSAAAHQAFAGDFARGAVAKQNKANTPPPPAPAPPPAPTPVAEPAWTPPDRKPPAPVVPADDRSADSAVVDPVGRGTPVGREGFENNQVGLSPQTKEAFASAFERPAPPPPPSAPAPEPTPADPKPSWESKARPEPREIVPGDHISHKGTGTRYKVVGRTTGDNPRLQVVTPDGRKKSVDWAKFVQNQGNYKHHPASPVLFVAKPKGDAGTPLPSGEPPAAKPTPPSPPPGPSVSPPPGPGDVPVGMPSPRREAGTGKTVKDKPIDDLGFSKIGEMGKAIGDSLRDALWESHQKKSLVMGGNKREPILVAAQKHGVSHTDKEGFLRFVEAYAKARNKWANENPSPIDRPGQPASKPGEPPPKPTSESPLSPSPAPSSGKSTTVSPTPGSQSPRGDTETSGPKKAPKFKAGDKLKVGVQEFQILDDFDPDTYDQDTIKIRAPGMRRDSLPIDIPIDSFYNYFGWKPYGHTESSGGSGPSSPPPPPPSPPSDVASPSSPPLSGEPPAAEPTPASPTPGPGDPNWRFYGSVPPSEAFVGSSFDDSVSPSEAFVNSSPLGPTRPGSRVYDPGGDPVYDPRFPGIDLRPPLKMHDLNPTPEETGIAQGQFQHFMSKGDSPTSALHKATAGVLLKRHINNGLSEDQARKLAWSQVTRSDSPPGMSANRYDPKGDTERYMAHFQSLGMSPKDAMKKVKEIARKGYGSGQARLPSVYDSSSSSQGSTLAQIARGVLTGGTGKVGPWFFKQGKEMPWLHEGNTPHDPYKMDGYIQGHGYGRPPIGDRAGGLGGSMGTYTPRVGFRDPVVPGSPAGPTPRAAGSAPSGSGGPVAAGPGAGYGPEAIILGNPLDPGGPAAASPPHGSPPAPGSPVPPSSDVIPVEGSDLVDDETGAGGAAPGASGSPPPPAPPAPMTPFEMQEAKKKQMDDMHIRHITDRTMNNPEMRAKLHKDNPFLRTAHLAAEDLGVPNLDRSQMEIAREMYENVIADNPDGISPAKILEHVKTKLIQKRLIDETDDTPAIKDSVWWLVSQTGAKLNDATKLIKVLAGRTGKDDPSHHDLKMAWFKYMDEQIGGKKDDDEPAKNP